MNETIENITNIILEYNEIEIDKTNGFYLNEMLKNLTTNLFYLETIRSKHHLNFEKIIHTEVSKGKSVARATNKANVEIPELYHLRRISNSAYRIADAIRTNISFLKSELSHLKSH
tara:strand:- start:275 stop:622 length:348 start_codon:yes stop_codon:yes gene_type:complete